MRIDQLFGQPLILPGPAIGQVAPLFAGGGILVKIPGYAQLTAHTLTQLTGILHHFLHTYIGYRHQRTYIYRPETRVCPLVLAHVYQLTGFFDKPEGRLNYRLRLPDKSDHRAVGGLAGVHIQQFYTLYGFYLRCNGIYYRLITAFADIGHTFNELFFHDTDRLVKRVCRQNYGKKIYVWQSAARVFSAA